MNPSLHRFTRVALPIALAIVAMPIAQASVVLGSGTDRSLCPDPTFNACYLGVDGTRTATAVGASSFSFVGLGVVSGEIAGVAFPAGAPASAPNGTLTVGTGASVTVVGDGSQGVNSSVTVGNGNGSSGTLLVSGGTVVAPILLVAQTDLRASNGTVVVSNGGTLTATVDASAAATLGSIGAGIGRSQGSIGSVTVTGVGSSFTTTAASISMGRLGAGTLDVEAGAHVASAGSLYASTASNLGTSNIVVSGVGSTLSTGPGGHLLLGITSDATTGTPLDQGYLVGSSAHGTATLNVRNGGVVHADVVMGSGGTLKGDGSIVGNVSNLGGTISPGNSPGTLHVNGNFVMDNGGLFVVEIGGAGPGMTDLLDITGTANLSNSTVLFSFIDGFAPSAGFTFDFLDAAQIALSNVTFATQGLRAGFAFTTAATDGVLSFTASVDGAALPEPETLPLLSVGLLGALALARRTRRASR